MGFGTARLPRSGHTSTSATRESTKMLLATAMRLRLKRRQACWLGLRCSCGACFGAEVSARVAVALLITNPWIEERVAEVNGQVQQQQQHRVQEHETDNHRVIAVQGAVNHKYADARDLEQILDDKRAGQQIRQERTRVRDDGQRTQTECVLEQRPCFA